MMQDLPTYEDVAIAAERLRHQAHRTPVLRSSTADARWGARFFFKCENFQRMGAFKFRGAFNALSRFDARRRQAGVVAFSSGNHAQAIALSARLLGMPATIVMPHDAPAAKVAATRGYGGTVVVYDRYREDRDTAARMMTPRRGSRSVTCGSRPGRTAAQSPVHGSATGSGDRTSDVPAWRGPFSVTTSHRPRSTPTIRAGTSPLARYEANDRSRPSSQPS